MSKLYFRYAAMNAGKRTRQAKQTVEPKRAVADYLKHLKAAGRRQGTGTGRGAWSR